MGKVLGLIARKAQWLLVGSLGFLLGILLKYPAGWELSDLNANVAGAAVASVASIAGAFLILRVQLAHEQRLAVASRIADDVERRHALEALKSALANALFTDLNGVDALITKSLELEAKHTMDNGEKRRWLTRMKLLPTPSFDRFHHLLPSLGDELGPLLMHSYGEILRVRAMTAGQELTNDNEIDNTDFVVILAKGNLPSLLKNLRLAKAELTPYTRFGDSPGAA